MDRVMPETPVDSAAECGGTIRPRLCVYTALNGHYEKLVEQPVARTSSIPFICFTDEPGLVSKTWQIRPLKPLFSEDHVRSQREYKLRPYRFLPDFDASLYIDNSVLLKVPPEDIFRAVDLSSGLSLPAHSHRASVLDEFERVATEQLDDPVRISEQLKYYKAENPELLTRKPFWNAIMLRDHHNPAMVAAMELWFSHILRFSRRDQLSNRFVFHTAGLQPQTLDIDNFESWFHTWPHVTDRKNARRTWQGPEHELADLRVKELHARYKKLEQKHQAILASTTWRATEPLRQIVQAYARGTPIATILRSRLPVVRSRRLIFAFGTDAAVWATALLRGDQLMALAGKARSDVAFRAIGLPALHRSSGEVVVLTKSALYDMTAETIAQLRQRGHRLIADFVDLPVDEAVARGVDVLLASSLTQERFFRNRFPEIPVYHITHHADLRLPRISPPADRARIGYFGEPKNLLHAHAIHDLVGIVTAEYPRQRDWMRRLTEFNAHLALRPTAENGVFKPFTKGFVAAHCGVPVIVSATDEEALHYLGAEYPFVIGDLSLQSVRAHITQFADMFATRQWTSAVETMRVIARQYGHQHVKAELRVFLNAVL